MSFLRQAEALKRQLEIAPFVGRLRELAPEAFDAELWGAVVEEAARFSREVLAPLNPQLDRAGCRLAEGRVVTIPAHRQAWAAFRDGGWPTLAIPEAIGGQGLPLTLLTACEELFNRACPAFMMLATPTRTAAALLASLAAEAVRAAWGPKLAAGEWAATICISEPDAGSDVGRIRTAARQGPDGRWRVTGEKCWISFGDHDLAPRIGHCLLARTSEAPGVRGLSLFLTPNVTDDGRSNGVVVRRIEEKLGLHGSPTCALGFEEAEAYLIGEPGRGLAQLFAMLLMMRLSCGPQGVGLAAGAAETALAYGLERRQGGAADAPPVPIAAHADVQRQLLGLHARVETARGLTLAAAAVMDLAEREPAAEARARSRALAAWLLPIVKEVSARAGLEVASDAIQVLGGAGYTRDWPLEQALRDARVFPLFEGTTGMQALDMLHRRLWREAGEGLGLFLELARADLAAAGAEGAPLAFVLDRLEAVSAILAGWESRPREAEAGATPYLNLCGLAATGWIAVRLARDAGTDPLGRRLAAAARHHLAELVARAQAEAALAELGAARLDGFADLL